MQLAPTPDNPSKSRFRVWLRRLLPVLGVALFIVAIFAIRHQLHKHKLEDVIASFENIPLKSVIWAGIWTIAGYFILTGYDYLAMKYINHDLKYRRVALAAFIGYAFSNSIGHSYLTGGTVRYRLYSVWGVGGLDIAKVIAFGHVAFYLGMLLLIGQGCLVEPHPVSSEVGIPPIVVQIIGGSMIALVGLYLVWTVRRRAPLRISVLHFPMPSLALSLSQLVTATLDMVLMGAVLYVLLPDNVGMSFAAFIGLFMIAQVIGVGSQVPGGLGVFETLMLHVLSPHIDGATVLATLVVYRIIYFLVPLIIGAALLGGYELRHHHRLLFSTRQSAIPPAPFKPKKRQIQS